MTMIRVTKGDLVRMRDGSIVKVTDAPESGGPLEWIDRRAYLDRGQEVVTATMPAETIFVGFDTGSKATVVSDMCEVQLVIDQSIPSR
jgi:hypothetical protein